MKAKLRLTDPDEVDVTVEITMPLHRWKQFRAQLGDGGGPSNYPTWRVDEVVYKAVLKAEKHFEEVEEIE